MLLDARDLADGSTLRADVCIAGAGAAGITIALSLRDSGLSVLVLESGGEEPEDANQALYEGSMVGIDTWRLDDMRVRTLGGATDHWAGWCRPLDEEDFEARAWMPHSGWPITRAELDPFYARAQATLQIGPLDYDPVARSKQSSRPLLPFALGGESRYYQLSPPTRFAKTYRSALAKAEDITVVLYANVVNIATSGAGSRASRFECATLSGVSFVAEASRYVLALGGIENARVLLASGDEDSDGVANGHGVVGRYFMEHPHYLGSATLVHGKLPDLEFYRGHGSDLRTADGSRTVSILGAIGLTRELRDSEELLNCSATLVKKPFDNTRTGKIPLDVTQALIARADDEPGVLTLSMRCEQSPIAESRIFLNENRDALGMRRVSLDWRIHPDDESRTRKTAEHFARELAALGLGRMWIPRDGKRFKWTAQPGGHHMGSTRMGLDPKTSVVDESCLCHEVDNLFVVGASAFTTGGDSNPTLTVTALAHRLAEHLKESA